MAMVIDLVCGMRIDTDDAAATTEHEHPGRREVRSTLVKRSSGASRRIVSACWRSARSS